MTHIKHYLFTPDYRVGNIFKKKWIEELNSAFDDTSLSNRSLLFPENVGYDITKISDTCWQVSIPLPGIRDDEIHLVYKDGYLNGKIDSKKQKFVTKNEFKIWIGRGIYDDFKSWMEDGILYVKYRKILEENGKEIPVLASSKASKE